MEIYEGPLHTKDIFSDWTDQESTSNFGAYIPFVGTVRDEGGISGLSFDIYEPILQAWFDQWQEKSKQLGAVVKMAHSRGDVPVHKASYMCAVFSPKRRVALELIDDFVEDFKANAPIWKYDLLGQKRIYASERSTPMQGAGLLAK